MDPRNAPRNHDAPRSARSSARGRSARSSDPSSPVEARQQLEGEIEDLRAEIGVMVHEIERRMRQAVSVRHQARRHPAVLIGGLLAVTAVVALMVGYRLRQRRRRPRFPRLTNLRVALAHLAEHPEDVVERGGHPTRDRLLGAGKAVGAFGAKRMIRRAFAG
jgi:hypothetical protein